MQKILTGKQECQDKFWHRVSIHAHELGSTKNALRKLLRSIDTVGWSKREESGRLDRRSFARFSTGDNAVFSRREYAEADTSAVSLLVDTSASTIKYVSDGKTRSDAFADVAACLSKLLDDCGASVKVTTFAGITSDDRSAETVRFTELKGYDESLRKCAANIGAIQQLVSGATPDYAAVYDEICTLSLRHEKRKVLILLTDADEFNYRNANKLQSIADKLGIIIIALCIGGDISKCYTNYVNVRSAKELFNGAFNKLLQSIRR